jgi:hypothetical protein
MRPDFVAAVFVCVMWSAAYGSDCLHGREGDSPTGGGCLPRQHLVFEPNSNDPSIEKMVTIGKLKVPDWNSPDWIDRYLNSKHAREGKGPFGIDLDSIRLAEQWGFMTGIREACGGDSDNYFAVIGTVLRAKGNTEYPEQMPVLILFYAFERENAKSQAKPEDCSSREITQWLDAQDQILNHWQSPGLKLLTFK